MNSKKLRFGRWVLLSLMAGLLVFSGCAGASFDKKAVGKVKKVAVILYSVPATIELFDDPKVRKKTLLQIAAAVITANNGVQAATVSHRTFIEELNRQNLGFTAISQADMLGNASYQKIANKWIATRREQKAKAKKAQSGAMKALSMLSSMSGGKTTPVGVGPKGVPEFGLVANYAAKSALTKEKGEMAYIKAAIAALGVDAAFLVNEHGYSFACNLCVGGNGAATTHTAFQVSIVDRSGKEILGMKEFFLTQAKSATMLIYLVNPLQFNSLFEGHGTKVAKVFANLFREESKK